MNERSPVHNNNGGTVPLREYIEALIAERDKAMKEALRQLEMRLAELNQLRAEVTEDRNRLVSRESYDTEHGALEERVNVVREQLSARLNVIEKDEAWVGRGSSLTVLGELQRRLITLENWRGKAALVVGAGVFLGGIVGAAVMRIFTGAFGL